MNVSNLLEEYAKQPFHTVILYFKQILRTVILEQHCGCNKRENLHVGLLSRYQTIFEIYI